MRPRAARLRTSIPSIGTRSAPSAFPGPTPTPRIVDVDTGEEELGQGDIGENDHPGATGDEGLLADAHRDGQRPARAPLDRPRAVVAQRRHRVHRMRKGYFQIVDRKKDMIICGGFNVYPRDIEDVLYQHPAVQLAGVVGMPDEYRGETVKAFVVLKEGRTASEEEFIAFCGEHLAKYKVPTSIEFRSELPLSALGKVLRRELVSFANGS